MSHDPITQNLLAEWFAELDVALGEPLTLPAPFSFDLDTTDFL
ncbi:hypothetical protein ACIQWB_04015 [Streptomyces olivaceus]